MAITDFLKKEKTGKPETKEVKSMKDIYQKMKSGAQYAHIIKKPYITEKATLLSEKNQYVFQTDPKANKNSIKKAIESIYKVKVLDVNIIKLPAKKKGWGKLAGSTQAICKAVVKIQDGQKIEILT